MDAAASDAHSTIYDDFATGGAWPGDNGIGTCRYPASGIRPLS